ncbi:hypothetical protein [Curtobacterium sp. MCSS17_015]|uniref:hypothetical protein n=1 Tax=Curtobacterium sp. MCSS17_015 TaxID=2175666 RepID=UPI0011B3AA95|nr:hypothetical protein [Curtobacterium sp. MCSS17_015]WIB25840.1 hypothetical protein DEJ18_12390 [Curtobacterium sp. MCSS17_015]
MSDLKHDYRGRFKGTPGIRIDGHALKRYHDGGTFRAECKCGEQSIAVLPSRARRHEWQRYHLQKLLRNRPSERSSARKVASDAQISLRQLDHWTRLGYLNAPTTGSGSPRYWSGDERFVAIEMGRLIRSGFTVEAAHTIARRHVEEPSPEDRYELDVGIEVRFTN